MTHTGRQTGRHIAIGQMRVDLLKSGRNPRPDRLYLTDYGPGDVPPDTSSGHMGERGDKRLRGEGKRVSRCAPGLANILR